MVVGLPAWIVPRRARDAAAVWRAALLCTGGLPRPHRARAGLALLAPTPLALPLVGLARRLGVTARARPDGDIEQIRVTDRGALEVLLDRLGGQDAVAAWHQMCAAAPERVTKRRC